MLPNGGWTLVDPTAMWRVAGAGLVSLALVGACVFLLTSEQTVSVEKLQLDISDVESESDLPDSVVQEMAEVWISLRPPPLHFSL